MTKEEKKVEEVEATESAPKKRATKSKVATVKQSFYKRGVGRYLVGQEIASEVVKKYGLEKYV